MNIGPMFLLVVCLAGEATVRAISDEVIALGGSLVLYPFGLKSEFVMKHCSGSDLFNPGTCEVAWGYVLAMVTTGLLVFCPLLAHHLIRITPRSKATVV